MIENKKLLEIGSGTGAQLTVLSRHCAQAVGIDLEQSTYEGERIAAIINYDGRKIPFPDSEFDAIYSSNVLEHISHQEEFQKEMLRVLKPGGYAIHILPTHSWRLWSCVGHYVALPRNIANHFSKRSRPAAAGRVPPPRPGKGWRSLAANALFPERHGELGNRFTEFLHFHPAQWKGRFAAGGWDLLDVKPMGIFYTGQMLFKERLSFSTREKLAPLLGSACYLYVLRKPDQPAALATLEFGRRHQ